MPARVRACERACLSALFVVAQIMGETRVLLSRVARCFAADFAGWPLRLWPP